MVEPESPPESPPAPQPTTMAEPESPPPPQPTTMAEPESPPPPQPTTMAEPEPPPPPPPQPTTMAEAEPESPPSPPPANLAELPDDIVLSILGRVPCKVDRGATSHICRAWRSMMARLNPPRPPPLPWLLLPSRYPDGPARVACVLSGCRGHNYLNVTQPGERFFGSYDGAWIFVHSDETRTQRIVNARTRQYRVLPSVLIRMDDLANYNIVILAATLSSAPNRPDCVGAAIVSRDIPAAGLIWHSPTPLTNRSIAFWRMGWLVAYEASDLMAMHHKEDVIYHNGAFHFLLIHGDHILVCTPGVKHQQPGVLLVDDEFRFFHPGGRGYDQRIRARYLVVSRGELLLVVRFAHRASQQTSKFKVFQATRRPKRRDADADKDDPFPVSVYPWAWTELDMPDGRILFVGYGCSRSYEADQYPGFEPGIYFLDDGMLYESVVFGSANIRLYPCRDNGKWSQGHIQDCFPRPNESIHSPPTWLLP